MICFWVVRRSGPLIIRRYYRLYSYYGYVYDIRLIFSTVIVRQSVFFFSLFSRLFGAYIHLHHFSDT